MAAINDLISQIQDPELRDRIQKEVNKLAKQKKFGLVFEDHMPECTPLYDMPIKRGCNVMLRDNEDNKAIYTVLKVDGDTVYCGKKDNQEEVATFCMNEIVRVAEFGEPIYPFLKPMDSVCNAPDSDLWHTLIEADNYHALQLLEYLYAGKVDCIYIDPPYNTGARDWKYNNDYVDGSDSYRHSKWLSFMQKRLLLAKKLLNPRSSVMIITIDEKEYLHLGCLLEELFPNANITMATDVINPRAGVARPGSFTRNHEYVYFVQVGELAIAPEQLEGDQPKNPIWFSLMRTGSNSARTDRPNLFYPVWVYPNGRLHSIGVNISLSESKESILPPEDGLLAIWPLRPDGTENTWQLGRTTLEEAFAQGTARISVQKSRMTVNYLRNAEKERIKKGEIIVKGRDSSGALILEHNEGAAKTKAPDSVWNKPSHDAGIYGSSLISQIFGGRRFSFPKSLYAVYDALRFCVQNNSEALIVDFFAGSGTTLHAVNLLNAEDGGHRRCIMITNNEVSNEENKTLTAQGHHPGDPEWEALGIARYVTWPRTVCSIEGHDVNGNPLKGTYLGSERAMADGFAANATYFKLGFLDKTAVELGMHFKEMLPVLWMKAGSIGKCPTIDGRTIPSMLILPENKFAILINENAYAAFEEEIANHPEIQTVFLATDYDVNYRAMVKNLNVETTYQLYRDYLDHFRLNMGRS